MEGRSGLGSGYRAEEEATGGGIVLFAYPDPFSPRVSLPLFQAAVSRIVPTGLFEVLEPQHQEIQDFRVVQEHHVADFEAPTVSVGCLYCTYFLHASELLELVVSWETSDISFFPCQARLLETE